MFLSIDMAQLELIASIAKAGCGTDKFTPIITAVQLTSDGETLTIVATDRYCAIVGKTELIADELQNEGTVLIAAADVALALKTLKPLKHGPLVTLELIDDFIVVTSAGGMQLRFAVVTGNYPPVERLLPTPDVELVATPAGVILDMSMVGRMSLIQLPGDGTLAASKTEGWSLNSMPTSSGEPGPVLLQRESQRSSILTTVRVLVQPKLKRS